MSQGRIKQNRKLGLIPFQQRNPVGNHSLHNIILETKFTNLGVDHTVSGTLIQTNDTPQEFAVKNFDLL